MGVVGEEKVDPAVTVETKMGVGAMAVFCITANGTNSGEWIDKGRLDDDPAGVDTEPMAGDLGGVPSL